MTEDFLHYIWKFGKFNFIGLKTVNGEPLSILKKGIHNHNAGPDFHDARIQIGDQLWAGNIEIHIKSSDWYKHKHQDDEAYRNVILHVVYENDRKVLNKEGAEIPAIELKGLFDEGLYWQYERMLQSDTLIPCANMLSQVDDFIMETMMERVLVERLEEKSGIIGKMLETNNGNWNETFYQWMARAFGLKINAEPMLILARELPQGIPARYVDKIEQLEALFFGVAGFLSDPQDEYSKLLLKEYTFLKRKHKLVEMNDSIWKFARLRPSAFPTLRIAQFAALLQRSKGLLSEVLAIGEIEKLTELLQVQPSAYWLNHYRFGKEVKPISGRPGKGFTDRLIINVICPFLFTYGHLRDEAFYRQRAMDLLDQLKPEQNAITRIYDELGFRMDGAFNSQAVIQLNSVYCKPKKCLNCAIGTHLLK